MSRNAIYTDGACSPNPGPGGWGWHSPQLRIAEWGFDPSTTNQRMELKAALAAVTSMEGPIEVLSDSQYVTNCFNQNWWRGWQKRGWKNAKGQPVANQDLWTPLVQVNSEKDIKWTWVRGHNGDPGNEEADRLAVLGRTSRSGGRSGF